MEACYVFQNAGDAEELGRKLTTTYPIQQWEGGLLRLRFIQVTALAASLAMATPTPQMSLLSFEVPRCALQKPAPSIAHFARLTASASAPSRSLVGNRGPTAHRTRRNPLPLPTTMAIRTVALASAIASAF